MLLAATVVPGSPLLVPAVASGVDEVTDRLRAVVEAAVRDLVAAAETGGADLVLVGSAPSTEWWPSGRAGGFGGLGVDLPVVLPEGPPRQVPEGITPAPASRPLSRALAVGAWLVARAAGRTAGALGVAEDASTEQCAAAGRGISDAGPRPVALLVVGDGTARTGPAAPGYADERAGPVHRAARNALATADLPGVLALEVSLGDALLVEGRAPWQVLAGAAAAAGRRWGTAVRLDEDVLGVASLVVEWRRST